MPGMDDLLNVSAEIDEYGEPIPTEEQGSEEITSPVSNETFTAIDEDSLEDLEFDNEVNAPADEVVDSEEIQDTPTPVEEVPEEKPVQTPEENAFFAEQRRQKQALERQQEVDKLVQERLKQSPEYQITQFLAQQYGMTPEQLQQQLQQANLQKEAEKQGVPMEFLQQREADLQRIRSMEEKLTKTEFDSWYNGKVSEANALKEQYKGVISDAEINDAMIYMLNDLKNTNVPLESVVRMKHGAKIEQHLINMAKQEALAEISGRKQSPLAPQGGKSSPVDSLSPEEAHIAKMMGISEKDYLKYKK